MTPEEEPHVWDEDEPTEEDPFKPDDKEVLTIIERLELRRARTMTYFLA